MENWQGKQKSASFHGYIFNEIKNTLKKKIKERFSTKKEDKVDVLLEKENFIVANNIETYENWQKKTYVEKVDLLDALGGLTFNSPDILKAEYQNTTEKNNLEELDLYIDKKYDLLLRVLGVPTYKEQTKILYPKETTPIKLSLESDDKLDIEKNTQYSEHLYPEEIFSLSDDVVTYIKRESDGGRLILEPISLLKKHGINTLKDWYKKTTDEKREILKSNYFSGAKDYIEKKPWGMTNKEYEDYLDSSYLATIKRITSSLLSSNRYVNMYNFHHLNKEKIVNAEKDRIKKLKEEILTSFNDKQDNSLSDS